MMKFKTIISAIIILTVGSCTKDFQELNTNPNAPSEVQPSLLLRQVIYNYGEEMSYEGFVAGNLLGQHFTMVDFNLFDRHSLSDPQLGGNPWPVIYSNLLDNELMLDKARSTEIFSIYEGPGLIMKAYMTAALTDIYGDVPYSEALSGSDGIIAPKYDAQEDIYTAPGGILDNLNQAIDLIENYSGNETLEGDILFNGDLNSWIIFANSLKIKYLLRISDKVNVFNDLQDIFTSGNYMTNNSQNATFNFTDGLPNSFRMASLRDGDFNLYVLSETMEEILESYNDPRQNVLFRPIGNDITNSVFTGLINGIDASQTSISIGDYSLAGMIFRDHTGDLEANFMTAWETSFLLAEAADRGLIWSNGQVLYESGVQMAFDYWQTDLPDDYLTSGLTEYGADGTSRLEQIITQKWIANSINGYEGWIEYRRTGFPNLKTLSASLNGDIIPFKMPYPADEVALNEQNFINSTGTNGNDINVPVWWDVE